MLPFLLICKCTRTSGRWHKAFIHPFAQVGAEPLPRQLSSQALLLVGFVDQRAGGGKLNADIGVTIIICGSFVLPGCAPIKNLGRLAEFIPTKLSPFNEVEKLSLLVCYY